MSSGTVVARARPDRLQRPTAGECTLAAFVLAAAVGLGYAVPAQMFWLFVTTTLLLVLCIVIGLVATRMHGRDLLAPLYLLVAAFLFYWVIRGYYLVWVPSAADYYVHRPIRSFLAEGQLVSVAALAAFAAGYSLARRSPQGAARVRESDIEPTPGAALGILAVSLVGWTARYVAMRSGSYAKLNFAGAVAASSVAATLGFVAFFACVTAVVIANRKPSRAWTTYAVVLSGGEVAFALLTGFKSHLVLLALAWLIGRQYGQRPGQAKAVVVRAKAVVAVAGVFVYLVIPMIQIDREVQNLLATRESGGSLVTDALDRTPGVYWRDRGSILSGYFSLQRLMQRTSSVESVALALHYTPALHPYRLGREWLQAVPDALVPSMLWPSKPKPETATFFSRVYALESGAQTAIVGPSVTGDMVMNFGLPGVVVGWALLGAFLQRAHRHVAVSGFAVRAVAVYAAVLLAILPALEATVARALVDLLQQVGLALGVVAFLRRTSRHA